MEPKVYSVTQLNRYLKMVFEKNTVLFNISIKGEITNFKEHSSGHLYFTLKDELSTIKCVMFKSYTSSVKFKLEDGLKVIVTGQVAIYEANGTYQIYCRDITKEGLGELYIKYEKLKQKLEEEGLFDVSHKKALPYLPSRVGIITSKTGAVIKDIINVSSRRFDKVNLLVYPASTQGADVARTVIEGIKTFNDLNNVDVIIIARGGGSFEDLFGFNDESLARQIYESKIPIVSAVGHETDFTICDFVSDLRAPTPSAAAEIVYPQLSDILSKIDMINIRMNQAVKNKIKFERQRLDGLKSAKLERLPKEKVASGMIKVDTYLKKAEGIMKLYLQKNRTKYVNLVATLDAISPLKTLTRGYIVAQNKNGKIVNKVSDVKVNDQLKLSMLDGKVVSKVMEVE